MPNSAAPVYYHQGNIQDTYMQIMPYINLYPVPLNTTYAVYRIDKKFGTGVPINREVVREFDGAKLYDYVDLIPGMEPVEPGEPLRIRMEIGGEKGAIIQFTVTYPNKPVDIKLSYSHSQKSVVLDF